MGVSFSIKNIPEDVAERLRVRAELNHRSLQGELMAILVAAAREGAPAPSRSSENQGCRSVEDTLQRLRSLFPTTVDTQATLSSTSLIRQMRDGRYGDDWAKTVAQKGAP